MPLTRPTSAVRHNCQTLREHPNRTAFADRKDRTLPAAPSDLVITMSDWLEQFPISHYFTLTYRCRRGQAAREAAFKDWIDAIEFLQRRPLSWLRSDEMTRYSGCGFPAVAEHHHGVLVSVRLVTCTTMRGLWDEFGDSQILPYRKGGGALPYTLKQAFPPLRQLRFWRQGVQALPRSTKAAIPRGGLSGIGARALLERTG